MRANPQFPADLFTFTEDILNGKYHFLCSRNTTVPDFPPPVNIHTKQFFYSKLKPYIAFNTVFNLLL